MVGWWWWGGEEKRKRLVEYKLAAASDVGERVLLTDMHVIELLHAVASSPPIVSNLF